MARRRRPERPADPAVTWSGYWARREAIAPRSHLEGMVVEPGTVGSPSAGDLVRVRTQRRELADLEAWACRGGLHAWCTANRRRCRPAPEAAMV